MLSIIIPMYNEVTYAEKCIKKLIKVVPKINLKYEIIIIEDGSTDGTYEILKKIRKKNWYIKVIHNEKRLGRGRALKYALNSAKGDVCVYMDTDLATDLKHLKEIVDSVKKNKGLAIGSRWLKDSKVKREKIRFFASWGYNLLIRLLFRDGIHDHQCGFKAFSKEMLNQILEDVEDNGWFWDTEIIIRAKKAGFFVKEIPVKWEEPRIKQESQSKVNILRDSIKMGKKAFKLRFSPSFIKRYNK